MFVSVSLCLIYTISCLTIGFLLLPFIGVARSTWRNYSALAIIATALMMGQCLFVIAWTGLGLMGYFFPIPIIVLMVLIVSIAIIFVRRDMVDLFNRLFGQITHHFLALPLHMKFVEILVVLVVILFGIFNASLPVRFGAGDGIFFYMVLPKLMAASGRLMPVIGYEHTHSISGLFGEMHHSVMLALGNEQAALLFVWVTTLTMLAILVSLCGSLGVGNVGKVVAMVMLLSSTAVSFYMIDGKVDVFAACLGLAALYWVVEVKRSSVNWSAFYLAGLFTGFAVVAKATYVIAVALPISIILLWEVRKSRYPMHVWIRFILIMILPLFTLVVKNSILFQEPFAPFVFLDGEIGDKYNSQGYWNSLDVARNILLTYPFALVYGDYLFQYGNLSGLYLAFAPLILLVPIDTWRKHHLLVRFSIVILITVLLGAVLQARYFAPRFMLPALLSLIPAIAFATENVYCSSRKNRWFRSVLMVCLCIGLIGYSTIEQDMKRLFRYKIQGVGICDLEGFPLPECHDMLAMNALAGIGDRINVSSGYTYWLRSDLIQCMATKDEQNLLNGGLDDMSKLYDLGFQYVEKVGDPWDLINVPASLNVSAKYSRDARGLSPAVSIYEISAKDPTIVPTFGCRQVNYPAWHVVARN